jgi:DNA adenine methylase
MKKINAFGYYGGKFNILTWLIPKLDSTTTFVDVFGGSMSVLLNKPESKVEVYNDRESEVVNFFKVLREKPKTLINQLSFTPFSREEFLYATKNFNNKNLSDTERARIFFIKAKQSMMSQITSDQWGFNVSKNKQAKSFINGIKKLKVISNRIQNVYIENKDFSWLIKTYDTEDTMFYCDPPYMQQTRVDGKSYFHEMSLNRHIELSVLLNKIKGSFAISGYDHPLYHKLYKNCKFEKTDPIGIGSSNTGRNKKSSTRVECLWRNYE